MTHTIRLGYVRKPDGTAEPVCEPPVDAFLLVLWRHAFQVSFEGGDRFLVTGTAGGGTQFDGRMRPSELVGIVARMVRDGLGLMESLLAALDGQYPFTTIAETVVGKARPRLLFVLDQPFVETEAPAFVTGGRVEMEAPRIEDDGGRLRVVVTGLPEDHPLRAWADRLIRDRARDAILDRILHGSDSDFA